MIWAIDLDDFSGKFCEQGKYPLLTTIHNMLIKVGQYPLLTTIHNIIIKAIYQGGKHGMTRDTLPHILMQKHQYSNHVEYPRSALFFTGLS